MWKKKDKWEYSFEPIGIVLDWRSIPAFNFLKIDEDEKLISIALLDNIKATIFKLRIRIKKLCGGSLLNRWRMTDPRRRSREWFKRYDDVSPGSYNYKKAFAVLEGAQLTAHVVLAHLNKEKEHNMIEIIDEIDALIVMLNFEKTL